MALRHAVLAVAFKLCIEDMVILLAEEAEEAAHRHVVLEVDLCHRHWLHRVVEHELARLALAVAQCLTACEILDDARLRLDVALFKLELCIIVVIPAQARRQRDGRLMADVARELRLGDGIEAIGVVVAIRALAKRLPLCIRLEILLALLIGRLVAVVARKLQRSLAQREVILITPTLEHLDLRGKGRAHRGELVGKVSWHRLILSVLLRLQHPLGHLHAAVRARAIQQRIDVAHAAELVDIIVVDTADRHICRHGLCSSQPRHHDRSCRCHHSSNQRFLHHHLSKSFQLIIVCHKIIVKMEIHENSIMNP